MLGASGGAVAKRERDGAVGDQIRQVALRCRARYAQGLGDRGGGEGRLGVLEQAGLVTRHRSEGDGRRSYVQRTPACDRLLGATPLPRPARVAFVCSQNSARSQLAESYWRSISDIPALSAGTRPARRVHPGAVSVARRHGLDLTHATPKLARDVLTGDELLIAVCDRAYEDVDGPLLHWSIPDPAVKEDPHAFDAAFDNITQRIDRLASSLEGEPR